MAYSPFDPDELLPGAQIIQRLLTKTRDNPEAVALTDALIPVNKRINLGRALRTSNTDETKVLRADGSGGYLWGSFPNTIIERRFSGSGTWVVPTGVTNIDVLLFGGGGGASTANGGSGSTIRVCMPTVPGQTMTWQVGAGGAQGAAFGNGQDGGATQMRNSISNPIATANGGKGCIYNQALPILGGVTLATGFFLGNTILRDGREAGFGPPRALPALSWGSDNEQGAAVSTMHGAGGVYISGGGMGPGISGYIQWRYVQP